LGIARQKIRQDRREMPDGNEGQRVNAQVSTRCEARGRNVRFGGFYGSENFARAVEIDSTFGGQCQTPRRSVDKAYPKPSLQWVMSFATADGDKPTSSAAPAKVPRSATR
jgi:hypothetical protein